MGAVRLVSQLFSPRGAGLLSDRSDGAVVFGSWRSCLDGPGEDLVVVRRDANALEIHCHGGLAAAEAVITSLERLGVVRQSWPVWLRSGDMTETEREAREALAGIGGPKAAAIVARQLAGELERGRDRIERLLATGARTEAGAALDRLVRAARVGLRLVRPWRVVLAGNVNAGKSSLVNALAGYTRSIVSPEPGTTRDLVETRIVLDGWEVDLVDTAGVREDGTRVGEVTGIERAGIARAAAACTTADLVIRVIDGQQTEDGRLTPPAHNEVLVVSKTDQVKARGPEFRPDAIWTSAVTGAGIADLATEIVRRLVPEETADPGLLTGAVPFTDRQVALVKDLRHAVENAVGLSGTLSNSRDRGAGGGGSRSE
jgi:tRNA modification GTPase